MELIHASADFEEIGVIDTFERFDAEVGLSDRGADNDFELILDEHIWSRSKINCGDCIYIDGTEWGGFVEKITHTVSDGRVRLYGSLWRGLLDRFAVVPDEGQTHTQITEADANAVLASLIGSCPDYIAVSNLPSGLVCGGQVRYKSVLSAAQTILENAGGRLDVTFSGGTVTVSACAKQDRSEEVEFSQEYDSSLTSTESVVTYNHIIALGQGAMLERDKVELWRLPDGTVTDDPTAEGIPSGNERRTYIYDYSSVESVSALEEAARRKLGEFGAQKSLEISIGGDSVQLEPGDIAGVRDMLTGMCATLTVTAKRLTITENSVKITHVLG